MKFRLLVILVFAGSLLACGSVERRVQAKATWYDVITEYEKRLDKCLTFDEAGEPIAYDPALPDCEVDPAEARDVENVIEAYMDAAKEFENDPSGSACTMVRAVNVLVKYTDEGFQENFSTPLVDAYCGVSELDALDLILAGEQAEDAIEREVE